MNGVAIVSEYLCRAVELGELIGMGIFITLLYSVVFCCYKFAYKYSLMDKKSKITMVVSLILLVALYIWFWIFQINKYNTIHMEYTVTIDDYVSFNDFYEKYEIISVNEDEFRVMEK